MVHTCSMCFQSFSRKRSLARHTKRFHEGQKELTQRGITLNCKTKSFVQDKKKKKENGAICEICNKKFAKKFALKKHIETVHLKIKPFLCDDCGKSFSGKGKLSTHVLAVHKGIRFDCNQCDKSFSRKCHLRTHFKIMHEVGIANSLKNCSKCSYSSVRNTNLKRHIFRVHKDPDSVHENKIE